MRSPTAPYLGRLLPKGLRGIGLPLQHGLEGLLPLATDRACSGVLQTVLGCEKMSGI